MTDALARGDRIEIRGFGSFALNHRPPRTGPQPKSGEKVPGAGKYVPHFKGGGELRERVISAEATARAIEFGNNGEATAVAFFIHRSESPIMRAIIWIIRLLLFFLLFGSRSRTTICHAELLFRRHPVATSAGVRDPGHLRRRRPDRSPRRLLDDAPAPRDLAPAPPGRAVEREKAVRHRDRALAAAESACRCPDPDVGNRILAMASSGGALPLFFALGWLAARIDIRQVVQSRALPPYPSGLSVSRSTSSPTDDRRLRRGGAHRPADRRPALRARQPVSPSRRDRPRDPDPPVLVDREDISDEHRRSSASLARIFLRRRLTARRLPFCAWRARAPTTSRCAICLRSTSGEGLGQAIGPPRRCLAMKA